jgi:hypothetical protein
MVSWVFWDRIIPTVDLIEFRTEENDVFNLILRRSINEERAMAEMKNKKLEKSRVS